MIHRLHRGFKLYSSMKRFQVRSSVESTRDENIYFSASVGRG